MTARRLCLVSRIPGVAGPASFQQRLADGLAARGIGVSYHLDDRPYYAILVIGGTKDLPGLIRARRRGTPVIQRLDGMNWIHRKVPTGLRHSLRAEFNNRILSAIRRRLADGIVYQSEFVRAWWEREAGPVTCSVNVVHNGVPLDVFTPHGAETPPADHHRLLVVEANFGGGYETGLEAAVALAERLHQEKGARLELVIAGRASEPIRHKWANLDLPIRWLGLVPMKDLPALLRSAHLAYAADINPACPNTVIEAMACGLPVVAFDTGALPELVTGDAGRLAPYGGNPWQLEPPDIDGLAQAAREVLKGQAKQRPAARARAEAAFGLDRMVDGYLAALGWDAHSG